MTYKVIEAFADLRDANHIYHVGDIYPRDGYKASIERCEELASKANLQHKPLIELIMPEKVEKPAEKVEAEKPVEEAKPKSTRGRKKTAMKEAEGGDVDAE